MNFADSTSMVINGRSEAVGAALTSQEPAKGPSELGDSDSDGGVRMTGEEEEEEEHGAFCLVSAILVGSALILDGDLDEIRKKRWCG
jgi:hypothetical protein